jgi:RNA polymerase sigma-70 factor, ECF subfamily
MSDLYVLSPALAIEAQIAQFYDLLLHIHPSSVVGLNRAVAVAMADGAEHGLRLIDEIET